MAKDSKDIIPLEVAKVWVANWKEYGVEYLQNYTLKGFRIPEEDITEVLNEDGVENVRTYLGIDKSKDSKGNQILVAHLLIVGIDADGKDMIDAEKGWFIYDFTTPCPSACDPSSPLNK